MYLITVQQAVAGVFVPRVVDLKRWAKTVLRQKIAAAELTIRIVSKEEITHLNASYRHKNKPTNVLAFPYEMPLHSTVLTPLLGDIVICAEVVLEEAKAQRKALEAHWAHMIVHGILHLLGYDHEEDKAAHVMEKEEITILKSLEFGNPYKMKKGEH